MTNSVMFAVQKCQ